MRVTFGLGSLSVVTGFCLVQACSGEDATPQADADAGGNGSTSSASSASSSGGSSSSSSSGGSTTSSSSGGTDGGSEGGTDAGKKSTMTFFVTSTGNGVNGGDFGGLKGADDKCAALAKAVGGGDHTWAAYLSAEGATVVNAKDRIGAGPWTNQKGVVVAKDLTTLHTTGIKSADIVDEKGAAVPANEHDILTGSKTDGTLFAATDASCKGYTVKIGDGAYVGHSDWETTSGKWNSAHAVKNCDSATIASVKGAARIYCFAKD